MDCAERCRLDAYLELARCRRRAVLPEQEPNAHCVLVELVARQMCDAKCRDRNRVPPEP